MYFIITTIRYQEVLIFGKIIWKNEYSLGVLEIDIQHQRLVLIANELYNLVCGDVDIHNSEFEATSRKLIDYTDYHLKFEESFLKSHGYSQIDFHKMQHDRFISQINEPVKRLVEPQQQDSLVLCDYLVKWVLNYIAKFDKALSIRVLAKIILLNLNHWSHAI